MPETLPATSDPDLDWAIGRMERWEASVLSASAAADDLLTNWTEGRDIARFWPGMTLAAVMKERYPAIGLRRVQQVLTAAATRAALPDETAGMSTAAIAEAGAVTQQDPVTKSCFVTHPGQGRGDQGGAHQGPQGGRGQAAHRGSGAGGQGRTQDRAGHARWPWSGPGHAAERDSASSRRRPGRRHVRQGPPNVVPREHPHSRRPDDAPAACASTQRARQREAREHERPSDHLPAPLVGAQRGHQRRLVRRPAGPVRGAGGAPWRHHRRGVV